MAALAALALAALLLGGCTRRADLNYRRAEAFFAQGEYRLAATEYERVATDYPQSDVADDALYKLGYLCRVHLEEPHQALAAYERLAQDYPNSPYADDALLWTVHIYARDLRQPAMAAKVCQEIDQRCPDLKGLRGRAHLEVARVDLATGDMKGALAEAELVRADFPDQQEPAAAALLLESTVFEHENRKPEEISAPLEKAAHDYPNTIAGSEAQRRLGMIYYVRGQENAKRQREALKQQARWLSGLTPVTEHADPRMTMIDAVTSLVDYGGSDIDAATVAALTGLGLVPSAPLPGDNAPTWQDDPVAQVLEACGCASSIVMTASKAEAWDAARLAVLRQQPALVAYSAQEPWVIVAGWRPLDNLVGYLSPGADAVRSEKSDAFMKDWQPAGKVVGYERFAAGAFYVAAVGGRRSSPSPDDLRRKAYARLAAALAKLPGAERPAAVAREATQDLRAAARDASQRPAMVQWAKTELPGWAEVRRMTSSFLSLDDQKLAGDAMHIADLVGSLRTAIVSARQGEAGEADWDAAAGLADRLTTEESNFGTALRAFVAQAGGGA